MREIIVEQAQRLMIWASQKIGLHFRERGGPDFQERELWWASLGENVGYEMNGKNHRFERPVIVVKKFAKDLLLIVPCTTKLKTGTWFFPYRFEGDERRAVLSQIRVVSNRRLIRKMGHISSQEFGALKKALSDLIFE